MVVVVTQNPETGKIELTKDELKAIIEDAVKETREQYAPLIYPVGIKDLKEPSIDLWKDSNVITTSSKTILNEEKTNR